MKTSITLLIVFCLLFSANAINSQEKDFDYLSAFRDTLTDLSANTDNEYLKIHFESILEVINSKVTYTTSDSGYISSLYRDFNFNESTNPKLLQTYLDRKRSIILAWTSPTDGNTSFTWLKLPANWDPEETYPVYIQLHGLWDVAADLFRYLVYPFQQPPSSSIAFEDGYLLSPWGRGNLWYTGISETDIWECLSALDEIVNIDPTRRYISGHSMGGYGSWHIALRSPDAWAALGVHAGALWYNGSSEVDEEDAQVLANMPTYFVCGTQDQLLSINQLAYQYLTDAGNQNLEFVTFNGGHEYLEENVINMYLWMRQFVNDNPDDAGETVIKETTHVWPNPFQSSVEISFNLPDETKANLNIVDLNGKTVEVLYSGVLNAGNHSFQWKPVGKPAGCYYYVLKTNKLIRTGQLLYNR